MTITPTRFKIWYTHQASGKIFEREVPEPITGLLILDIIYDLALLLFENNMIPDYVNDGGVIYLDDDGNWVDYKEEANTS